MLALALLGSLVTVRTAANTLPRTKVAQVVQPLLAEQFKPSACSAITVTRLRVGSTVVFGSGNADVLLGTGANDLLRGGNGNDCIIGGGGVDDCRGGGGVDYFISCESIQQ